MDVRKPRLSVVVATARSQQDGEDFAQMPKLLLNGLKAAPS